MSDSNLPGKIRASSQSPSDNGEQSNRLLSLVSSYIVQPKDSLSSLTVKFGISEPTLSWLNSLLCGQFFPGGTIYVPRACLNELDPADFTTRDSGAIRYNHDNQGLEDELRHEKHALEILRECCNTIYSSEGREESKFCSTMLNHTEHVVVRDSSTDRSSSFPEISRSEIPNSILSANCTMLLNEGSVAGILGMSPAGLIFRPKVIGQQQVGGYERQSISIRLSPSDRLELRVVDFDRVGSNVKVALPDLFRSRRQTFPLSQRDDDFEVKRALDDDWATASLENMKILQISKRKEPEAIFNFGMSDHLAKQFQNLLELHSVCSSDSSVFSNTLLGELYLGPTLISKSTLLNQNHAINLSSHLPANLRTCNLSLTYGSSQHGTSLQTLYRRAHEREGASLLVVADDNGGLFGCFSPVTWRSSLHPFGTGEAFLFQLSPNFAVYHWSGDHSPIMVADMNQLAMGAGGHYGLWLNFDLLSGSSFPSSTFNNLPLAKKNDFSIIGIELWTFVEQNMEVEDYK